MTATTRTLSRAGRVLTPGRTEEDDGPPCHRPARSGSTALPRR